MTSFNGTSGDDVFNGTDENDSAQGFLGNDRLFGNGGDDWMTGGAGADLLDGGDGDDRLASYEATYSFREGDPSQDYDLDHDILNGGAGSDRLWAGYGDDVDGGPGIDYLGLMLVTGPAGVIIDFTLGPASIGGGTISNIENLGTVIGTGYDDYIRMVNSAPGGFSFVNGQGGNDTLIAAAYGSILIGDEGNDLLVAGPGVDQLSGGAGSDTFLGQTNSLSGDTISDLSRGDRIIISDAALNGFTVNVVGHQLSYTGGSLTLTSSAQLSLTVSAASAGGVQIAFDGIPIIIGGGKPVSLASAEMIPSKSPVSAEIFQANNWQGDGSQISILDQTYAFHASADLLIWH